MSNNFEDPEKQKSLTELAEKLNEKELAWVHAFMRSLNKTKASLEVGFAPSNAANMGCEIYQRPRVNDYITALRFQLIGDPDDNIKAIKNIADANLNDYLSPVSYITSDKIEISINQHIESLEIELEIELKYFLDYTETKLERTRSLNRISGLKKSIGRAKIEQEFNPGAKKIVTGPEYLKTEMRLDLTKLSQDKEHGVIKSIKHTKEGVQVETYSALDAKIALAKINGSYGKHNKQLQPVNNINLPFTGDLSKLTEEQLKTMSEIEKIIHS